MPYCSVPQDVYEAAVAGEILRSVRRGEVDYEDVLELSHTLENTLEDAIANCDWPAKPDAYGIDLFSVKMHQLTWAERGEVYGGMNL